MFYAELLGEVEEKALEMGIEIVSQQGIIQNLLSDKENAQGAQKKIESELKKALVEVHDLKYRLSKEKLPVHDKKSEKWSSLEKVQMENEIALLRSELQKSTISEKKIQESTSSVKNQNFFEDFFKEYKRKYESTTFSCTKLQYELGQTKDQMRMLKGIVDSYQEVKAALQNEINALSKANSDLKLLQNISEEKISDLQAEISKNMNCYKEQTILEEEKVALEKKLSQLEAQVLSGNIYMKHSEEFVPASDPVFDLVKNPEKYKLRKSGRGEKKEIAKSHVQGTNSLDLNLLKPCRPTFASLLKVPSHQVLYSPPSADWLFTTVRGILDSKYYEHTLCMQGNSLPGSFPEFVYDWLGSFYVDPATRTVKQLEWWSKNSADDLRLQLLTGISQTRAKNIWELNTFREFLLEELDLDELSFFLHCRFLLYSGPQLSHSAGRFMPMHYISFPKAKEIISIVMDGLTQEGTIQLFDLIKKKCKGNKGVESAFILRTLLEYYHREKKIRFLAIQDLFVKTASGDFTFANFKEICGALDNTLSPYLVAKCYREAFMEGNGIITPETFYVVANNMLFYFMLRLKSPWKIPNMNEFGDIDASASPYCAYMAKVNSLYVLHKKDIEVVTKFVETLGIPDFQRQINRLEGILQRKYQVFDDFRHWNLADIFKQYWLLVSRLKSMFYESNSLNSLTTHKVLESKEKELLETIKANEFFIQDIYQLNINSIAARILLRRFQMRAKNKRRGLTIMRSVVKTLTLYKGKAFTKNE